MSLNEKVKQKVKQKLKEKGEKLNLKVKLWQTHNEQVKARSWGCFFSS